MKFVLILLSLSLLALLGHEAAKLQQETTCRQEAWRASLHLHTRRLLSKPESQETALLPNCRIIIARKGQAVSWSRKLVSRPRTVSLRLKGTL